MRSSSATADECPANTRLLERTDRQRARLDALDVQALKGVECLRSGRPDLPDRALRGDHRTVPGLERGRRSCDALSAIYLPARQPPFLKRPDLPLVANVFEPSWDAEQQREPFCWKRARIGCQSGSQKLGASLYELAPGTSSWPLHIHYANEELIVVLAGRPTLRTLGGERELAAGEVVACPPGRSGAHRLDNRTAEAARMLIVSTMIAPELNEYPDSGKLWGRSTAPGADAGPDAMEVMARPEYNLDYFDGET
jgi:uncharacterized cupin superfamily protein